MARIDPVTDKALDEKKPWEQETTQVRACVIV